MKGTTRPPDDPGENSNKIHDIVESCMAIGSRKLSNQSPMSDSETQIRRQSSGLDKKSICSLPSPTREQYFMSQSQPIGRHISETSGTFEWWIHKFSRSSNRSRFDGKILMIWLLVWNFCDFKNYLNFKLAWTFTTIPLKFNREIGNEISLNFNQHQILYQINFSLKSRANCSSTAAGSSSSTTHRSSPVSCCGSSQGRSSSPDLHDHENDCYIALSPNNNLTNTSNLNNHNVITNYKQNRNSDCDSNPERDQEENNFEDNTKLLLSQG